MAVSQRSFGIINTSNNMENIANRLLQSDYFFRID